MSLTEDDLQQIQSALPRDGQKPKLKGGRPKRIILTNQEKIAEMNEHRDLHFAKLSLDAVYAAADLLIDPDVKPETKAKLIDRILTLNIQKESSRKISDDNPTGDTIIISDSME